MNYLYLTQGTRIMDEWYDNTLTPLFQYHFLKCIGHGHYTHVGPGIYPTPARRDDTGYKPEGYILTKNSINNHPIYLDYHNNEYIYIYIYLCIYYILDGEIKAWKDYVKHLLDLCYVQHLQRRILIFQG